MVCKGNVLFPDNGKLLMVLFLHVCRQCRRPFHNNHRIFRSDIPPSADSRGRERCFSDGSRKPFVRFSDTLLTAVKNAFGSSRNPSAVNTRHHQTGPAAPSREPHRMVTRDSSYSLKRPCTSWRALPCSAAKADSGFLDKAAMISEAHRLTFTRDTARSRYNT